MHRMLTHLKRPHRYVEFEGLGHGIKGIDNNRRFYRECFRFLDDVIGRDTSLYRWDTVR